MASGGFDGPALTSGSFLGDFFAVAQSGGDGRTLVVTTLQDSGAGSLREALSLAWGTHAPETIVFDPNLAGGTIHLTSGELLINSSVRIMGSGVTIDANADGDLDAATNGGGFGSGRAFRVTNPLATLIEDLTITGGRTTQDGEGGGAILHEAGFLEISNATFTGNVTLGAGAGGGAIRSEVPDGSLPSFPSLLIENSTIAGNFTFGSGSNGGGIAAVTARITSTTITGNATFGDAGGGGVFVGSAGIYSSLILGNVAARAPQNDLLLLSEISTGSPISDLLLGTFELRRAADSLIGDEADPTSVFAQTRALTAGSKTVQAGVLADNGGDAETVALRIGPFNPAIDRGDDGRAPAQDQRGEDRLDYYSYWGLADAGSFEVTPRDIALAPRPAIVVTSTADSGAGSLRAAIAQANATLGRDVILFAPTLAGQTITLTSGTLVVTDDVTIGGPARFGTLVLSPAGALDVRIDANADGDANAATSGGGDRRAFTIINAADVTLDSLRITGGATAADGAGGGGIAAGSGTSLTILNSTISGNSTRGALAAGGAIYASGDSLRIDSSTISGNRTSGSDAGGGGIFSQATQLTLTDSTVAGNRVSGSGADGGGIAAGGSGSVTINNATITGNAANDDGGGLNAAPLSRVVLSNAIVLGNLAGGGPDDVAGPIARTTSLVGGDSGVTAAGVFAQTTTLTAEGRSVQAGVLADNGGPTQTVALRRDLSNPAIDGATGVPAEPTDQRGQARVDATPGGGIADIGAFEAQGDPIDRTPTTTRFEILVTTLDDVVDAFDGKTSLREAIDYANRRPGADFIYVAGGVPREIHLGPLGALVISDDVTISGGPVPGFLTTGDRPIHALVIDANADGDNDASTRADGTEAGFSARRAFDIRLAASATLEKLVVTGGRVEVTGDTPADMAGGGGLLVRAGSELRLVDSTVTGNTATGDGARGGGIFAYAGSGGFLTASPVSLTLVNSTVVDNHVAGLAVRGGGVAGAAGATLAITNTTITGNTATVGAGTNPLVQAGGGLFNDGTTALTNTIVLGNNAGGRTDDAAISGGAVTRVTSLLGGDPGLTPGMVFAETAALTVQGRTVQAGVARDAGQAPTVALNPLLNNPAIDGGTDAAAPRLDQLGGGRTDVFPGGSASDIGAREGAAGATILVTTLADTVSATDGLTSLREAVALANAVPGAQTIRFADAVAGGTIRLGAAGAIAVTGDVTIDGGPAGITIDINADGDGNTATQAASGARRGFVVSGAGTDAVFDTLTLTGGRAASDEGGGAVFGGAGTTITFEGSTLSGNQAPGSFGVGGAVYSQGAVTLRNSTVADNRAGLAVGGVYAPSILAESTTVTANASPLDAGLSAGGALTLTNSIVLGNVGSRELYAPGTLTRTASLVGGDAGLLATDVFAATRTITVVAGDGSTLTGRGGVLAANGGPTQTVALLERGSNPAIDGATGTAPDTDQRGVARKDLLLGDKPADIGAFEAQSVRDPVVTTLADTVDPNDGRTSLREAILIANANAGADVITFAAGLSGAIHLGLAGQLSITDALTIRGGGRITIDANADRDGREGTLGFVDGVGQRAFMVGANVGATFDGLVITGGRVNGASGTGGGVMALAGGTLTFVDTDVSLNRAGKAGGGVFTLGSLTALRSSFEFNNVLSYGPPKGGGLFVAGDATITASAITNNRIAPAYSSRFQAYGGGAYVGGALTLTSSTVAGNFVFGRDLDGGGGGLYVRGGATVAGSTITGNLFGTAGLNQGYGGGAVAAGGLTLRDSLVLGNELGGYVGRAVPNAGANDVGGVFTTDGRSLVGGDATQVFALTTELQGHTLPDGTDVVVRGGVATDNGGPTPTVALLADATNPAIDAAGSTATTFDQRGLPRQDLLPNAGRADLGAFELQAGTTPLSLVVTTLADVVDSFDGQTSLREAIALANGKAGAEVVTFAAGLSGTIHLGTGGQLSITDALTIRGGGLITIDANADRDGDAATLGAITGAGQRAFSVGANVDATFDGLVITGGQVSGSTGGGGGVRGLGGSTLRFVDTEVSGNRATITGGGVVAQGSLTALRSSFEDNQVTGSGALRGGGLSVTGDASLTDSTIAGNALNATRGFAFVYGGGAYVGGTLTLTGSTVAGNRVNGSDISTGGGAGLYARGAATVAGSTITGNLFGTGGFNQGYGGGAVAAGGLTLRDSLVLGNMLGGRVGEYVPNAGTNDIGGAFTTDGRSIVGGDATKVFAATAAVGTQTLPDGTDVVIRGGVAADNGGPPRTVALRADATNPAIDAAGSTAPPFDQRGLSRQDLLPNAGQADLGAFELQAGTTPPSLVVTTLADVVDGFDGQTSLREAIAFANGKAGADVVTFAAGLSGTIHLGAGGQLSITEALTILGGGRITIDANADRDGDAATLGGITGAGQRAFTVGANVDATFDGLVITGGQVSGSTGAGGGVRGLGGSTLRFVDTEVSGNKAIISGGGVQTLGSLTALRSSFEGNQVTGGSTLKGGGLHVGGSATITASTIAGNALNAFVGDLAFGGGAYVGGTLTLTGSTVAGNRVTGSYNGGGGGGLYAGGAATIAGSTITGNLFGTGGINGGYGGGAVAGGGLTLRDSLVLGNMLGGYVGPRDPNAGTNDIGGAFTTDGRSLVGGDATKVFATTAAVGTQTQADGTELVLRGGVVADNGGPTRTVALLVDAANPAIGAANPATATAADQRGTPRDAAPDLGAYEAPNPTPVATDDSGSVPQNGTVAGPLPASGTVVIDVLANDSDVIGGLDPASVRILGAPGAGRTLVVDGEGTWAVDPATGAIAFTPAFLFAGPVTPIRYTVADRLGAVSASAAVAVAITPGVGVSLGGGTDADGLAGTGFADTLSGLGGQDTLLGYQGNDSLDGGADADSMAGGQGDDAYVVDHAGDMVVEQPGGGLDRVLASVSFTLPQEVEALTLTGPVAKRGIGNALGNAITGNARDNLLAGVEGADTLDGLAGNDLLSAGTGDDSAAGGDGADTVLGGAGQDLLDGGAAADSLDGAAGNDTATGGAGDDQLLGRGGADSLDGGDGHDTLLGGTGNDTLVGGGEDDLLAGGVGADLLFGGAGADAFRFDAPGGGIDTIADFDAADEIWISATGFGGMLAEGILTAAAFTTGPKAVGPAPQLVYNTVTGVLAWDADGAGGAAAMRIAVLSGAPALQASDILVVA